MESIRKVASFCFREAAILQGMLNIKKGDK